MYQIKDQTNRLLFLSVLLCFMATPYESVPIFANFSVVKLCVLVSFFFWILFSRKWENNRMITCFVILALYILFTMVFSINVYNCFNELYGFFLPTIIFSGIVSSSVQTKKELRSILVAYLLGVIILAVVMLRKSQLYISSNLIEGEVRFTIFGQDQNELSFLLVMGIVILLHQLLHTTKKKYYLLFFALIVLLLYCILLSGSRTGIIMAFSVFLLFVLAKKKYMPLLVLFCLFLFPIIISYVPESTYSRLLDTNEQIKSGDFTGRGEIWKVGFMGFLNENLLLGVGFRNFPELHAKYSNGLYFASHNTYLSALSELGFFGFFLFVYLLYLILYYTKKVVMYTRNVFIYAYIVPILLAMLTLDLGGRRWIFLIAILIYKYYQLLRLDSIQLHRSLPKYNNSPNRIL